MGSVSFNQKKVLFTNENAELSERQLDRIIEMAWEDRTPFEAITYQFGLPEKEVIKLMRSHLKRSSFNRWRARVNSGVSQKHLKKRNSEIDRFKCSRQRAISGNKISKR
ncbi:TIGR03643 family protein [Maribacter sp.]|nr:TIGR03643 family protein [Maribacter sp.]